MYFKWSIILILLFSCKKQESYPVEIIGHAGNGLNISTSIYHANSLESIELALGTVGVSGIEIDLQLSADNEFWLLHDDKLETETSGSGCISESTYEQLKNVHFKTINKEKLVRFKDLDFSKYSGKTIYMDIRHYNGCNEALLPFENIQTALNEALTGWNNIHFIVITNHKPWLNGFSAAGWTTYSDIQTMDEFTTLKQGNYAYDGVVIRNSEATKEDVNTIKSENKKVILFDMRAPKPTRQAIRKQPDAIIVDDLKTALIEKSK
jgi:glycerophosphoryl diester phosphodiesterase